MNLNIRIKTIYVLRNPEIAKNGAMIIFDLVQDSI